MPATTREQIYQALFAKLAAASAFAQGTTSRRWVSWQDDPSQSLITLPLLVLFEMWEHYDYKGERGLPPIRTLEARVLCYGKIPNDPGSLGVKDATTPGASVLNPLIDSVEASIAADPIYDGVQTLGGLVIDCRIEGQITKVLGDEDPSGICGAIIPIKILWQ